MPKITEATVRRAMIRCWNRAKRNKAALAAASQDVFSKDYIKRHFDKIKIVIGHIKKPRGGVRAAALMSCKYLKYDMENDMLHANHVLRINPKLLKSSGYVLEDVVAHELAHFIDHCVIRKSTHDLDFLHNMLLLSRKTNLEEKILGFMGNYFYKNTKKGPVIRSYASILRYRSYR